MRSCAYMTVCPHTGLLGAAYSAVARRSDVGSDPCAHDGAYVGARHRGPCGRPAAIPRQASEGCSRGKMPRALDADLHAIRQDIPPDTHVVCRQCAVSPATVAGRLCLGACPFLWIGICRPCAVSPPLILGAFALATGRLPSFLWLGICRPCAVSPPLTLGALALVWLGFADRLRFFPQKTETV